MTPATKRPPRKADLIIERARELLAANANLTGTRSAGHRSNDEHEQ